MVRTRFTALAATLALLAFAGPATAATFKGKTENNGSVNFKTKNGKIKAFGANVLMFCSNGGGFEQRVVYLKSIKVRKGGRFSYKGEDRDGTDVVVKGRLKGRKATGTIEVSYAKPADSGGFSFCNADRKFTAKAK
jgi:hypothetical protein